MGVVELAVDYGTSNTVAVLRWRDGHSRPLLFDGSPLLPSAVFAHPDGRLLTGRDAIHAGRSDPARFEPNPKQRVDEAEVLLGDRAVPVSMLVAATLGRVVGEAVRVAGGLPDRTVLTHPASWAGRRQTVLVTAAAAAGLARFRLVPEPAAAATYLAESGDWAGAGEYVVVYDLGAGTFDVSVVQRIGTGFRVLASAGLPDVGGVDFDALVLARVATSLHEPEQELWQAIMAPTDSRHHQWSRLVWESAREAKELLSREASAGIYLPGLDRDTVITRAEFDLDALALIDRTVTVLETTLQSAGVTARQIGTLFLVGGGSRIPLVATRLHQRLLIAPTVFEQPEMAVCEGAAAAAVHFPDTLAPPPALHFAPPTVIAVPDESTAPGDHRTLSATATVAAEQPTTAEPTTAALRRPELRTAAPDPPAEHRQEHSHGDDPLGQPATMPLLGVAGRWGSLTRRRKVWGATIVAGVAVIALVAVTAQVLAAPASPRSTAQLITHAPAARTPTRGGQATSAAVNTSTAPSGPQPTSIIRAGGSSISDVVFRPGGTLLAIGTLGGNVSLWNIQKPSQPGKVADLDQADDAIVDLDINATGKTLAIATRGGKVILVDITDPAHPATRATLTVSSPRSVIFSPAGHLLVTVALFTATLWNIDNPAQPSELHTWGRTGTNDLGNGLGTFSPDGTLFATTESGGSVQIYDVNDPDLPKTIVRPANKFVAAVAFDPGNRNTLAVLYSRGAQLWDLTNPAAPQAGDQNTTAVIMAVAAHRQACADLNGNWTVTDTSTQHPAVIARGPGQHFTAAIALSPDGKTVAVAANTDLSIWPI